MADADQPAHALPFEIAEPGDGSVVATSGTAVLLVLDDLAPRKAFPKPGEAGAKVFRRRGIKGFGTPLARPVEWVVVELACGTRVYFDGTRTVVTKRDLNP